MAQRWGTITLLKLMATILNYYFRNRTTISNDPSVTPTLFGVIDTCFDSVQACHDAVKLVLPIGD